MNDWAHYLRGVDNRSFAMDNRSFAKIDRLLTNDTFWYVSRTTLGFFKRRITAPRPTIVILDPVKSMLSVKTGTHSHLGEDGQLPNFRKVAIFDRDGIKKY